MKKNRVNQDDIDSANTRVAYMKAYRLMQSSQQDEIANGVQAMVCLIVAIRQLKAQQGEKWLKQFVGEAIATCNDATSKEEGATRYAVSPWGTLQ